MKQLHEHRESIDRQYALRGRAIERRAGGTLSVHANGTSVALSSGFILGVQLQK